MCPHCGQNAPIVYRGVTAYCAACGHVRIPLTGEALHLAGQPSRFGSIVARVLGWIVLFGGLSFALGIGALAHLLFPTGVAGLAVGGPIAVLSLVIGVLLLRGGKRLDQKGASAEKNARAGAVFALAAHKGGTLTALETSRSLDMPLAAAEALLQTLAKDDYEKVAVDVDANGTLVYRFVLPVRAGEGPGATRIRVDPEVARSPNRAEWERLEAEEAERKSSVDRARANR
jgi:hypothetical protein